MSKENLWKALNFQFLFVIFEISSDIVAAYSKDPAFNAYVYLAYRDDQVYNLIFFSAIYRQKLSVLWPIRIF